MANAVKPTNGKPKARRPLADFCESRGVGGRNGIRATYDAARTTDEFKNYWANADTLDADSANSISVRQTLTKRARYEVANNGYADGMVQTHANYLVGTGPSLRMLTGSTGFNQAVELVWRRWAKAIQLRRKLWAMAHAKVQDGETFGIIRMNPNVRHRVPMDLVLIEAEQCQSPNVPFAQAGYIDGIRFDDWGNPLWYDILRYHPGGAWSFDPETERVPAKFICHWFMLRRPGAHRGVPEFKSTLNTGAASRRWREATLASAEAAADFSVLLKTQMSPDDGADPAAAFSTIDLTKRMMTALPMGWDAGQMKAEHPNATFEAFHKTLINEQARPKSIPYNLAACDSSSYNYASGRLDHQTYFSGLDIEREDGNDLVLDPLFDRWWPLAVKTFGWVSDPDNPPDHIWDWPKHPVADIKSESSANDQKLRNGTASPSSIYSECGQDFEDALAEMATDYGITPEAMREILLQTIFAPKSGGTLPAATSASKGNAE